MATTTYNPMQNAYQNDPARTYQGPVLRTVPALPEEEPRAFHGLLLEVAGLTPAKAEDAADLTDMLERPKLAEALRRLAGAVNLYRTLYGTLPEPEDLGTRFTISGGEQVEFGSAKWFEQIDEISF